MIKIILLIGFCVLSIVAYVLYKVSLKDKNKKTILAAVFSILLLVATIINVIMIKSDKEMPKNGTQQSEIQSQRRIENDSNGKKIPSNGDKKPDKQNDTNINESTNKSYGDEKNIYNSDKNNRHKNDEKYTNNSSLTEGKVNNND